MRFFPAVRVSSRAVAAVSAALMLLLTVGPVHCVPKRTRRSGSKSAYAR
jgi:hypothetical protein